MNDKRFRGVEFLEKIMRLLDGTLTDAEFSDLDRMLAADPQAAVYYMEYLAAHVGLTEMGQVVPMPAADQVGGMQPLSPEQIRTLLDLKMPPTQAPATLQFEPELSEEEKRQRIESYAREQLENFLKQERPEPVVYRPRRARRNLIRFVYDTWATVEWLLQASVRVAKTTAKAAVVAAILGLIGLLVYANRTVGTVVETEQARWNVPLQEQAKLKPRRLRLQEGYARIRLNKGAEIILQAPSTLELKSANRIILDTGWMTAHVPEQARGFVVDTPLSRVVDYGTEFGLLVGSDTASELHVFQGKVGVENWNHLTPFQESFTAGQAAIQDIQGHVDRRAVQGRTRLFMRTLPGSTGLGFPGQRLNLADMVGGGNGFGTGRAGGGLNPSTGQVTPVPELLLIQAGGFQPVLSLMFIDGVFIPDGSMGPQVVTSTGLTFDDCPDTLGLCRETIISGAFFLESPFQVKAADITGVTHTHQPCISMHANAGLTFDLKKIRSVMSDVTIRRFTTQCGLAKDAGTMSATPVGIWVLVDGRVLFGGQVTPEDPKTETIDLDLTADQRFLTLAVTVPPEVEHSSTLMFVQPVLELVAAP